MNKSILAAALLIGLMPNGCRHNDPITYRLVLPDNYIGWVRVDFVGDTHTDKFDSRNRLTLRVREDGTCLTDAPIVIGTPTKYMFLYDKPGGLRPVRDDYVDHSLDAGGMTARSDIRDESGVHGMSWFFFVGPKAYRDKHPSQEFTYSNLPKPGRMEAGVER